jgi:hypothetical protein
MSTSRLLCGAAFPGCGLAFQRVRLAAPAVFFSLFLTLLLSSVLAAQPHIDNVLEKMVPPTATGLVGAHMDQIKQTDLYRRLLAVQGLGQLDQFARETGFDPRRDVREILFVTEGSGAVLLARGAFHLNPAVLKSFTKDRQGQYDIWRQGANGFCILDSTLAAAGDIPAVTDALKEWTSGAHTGTQRLLGFASSVNPQFQIWGVSTGAGNFLADHPPAPNTGLDFTAIFRSLQDYWFQADFSSGMRAEIHANAHVEKDAMNIRDAVRGLVGLGRLNTPDNQPDLLKVWDGISVDQQGRSISIRADMPQNLIDRLVEMLSPGKQ